LNKTKRRAPTVIFLTSSIAASSIDCEHFDDDGDIVVSLLLVEIESVSLIVLVCSVRFGGGLLTLQIQFKIQTSNSAVVLW